MKPNTNSTYSYSEGPDFDYDYSVPGLIILVAGIILLFFNIILGLMALLVSACLLFSRKVTRIDFNTRKIF